MIGCYKQRKIGTSGHWKKRGPTQPQGLAGRTHSWAAIKGTTVLVNIFQFSGLCHMTEHIIFQGREPHWLSWVQGWHLSQGKCGNFEGQFHTYCVHWERVVDQTWSGDTFTRRRRNACWPVRRNRWPVKTTSPDEWPSIHMPSASSPTSHISRCHRLGPSHPPSQRSLHSLLKLSPCSMLPPTVCSAHGSLREFQNPSQIKLDLCSQRPTEVNPINLTAKSNARPSVPAPLGLPVLFSCHFPHCSPCCSHIGLLPTSWMCQDFLIPGSWHLLTPLPGPQSYRWL